MIPPLALTQERARRLLGYIQEYRRLALTRIAPSQERNTNQRLLQALQGKLLRDAEQLRPQGALYYLSLTSEDIAALQTMITDLRTLKVQEPATNHRDSVIVDLTALKGTLEKLSTYGPKSHYTQSLL